MTTTVTALESARPIATDSIRPFEIRVLEEELVELRRRIAATRWPDKETVTDRSQGAQLAALATYVVEKGKPLITLVK